MSIKKIQEPQILALNIAKAVASTDKRERSKLIGEVNVTVGELLRAAHYRHPQSFMSSDEKAIADYFDKLSKIIVEGEKQERKKVSNNFTTSYALAHGLTTAEAELAKELVGTLRVKVEEAEGEVEKEIIVCSDSLKEKDLLPAPKHIRIKKPGPDIALETVTLSPDFVNFLREKHSKENHLMHLLTRSKFEAWLNTTLGKNWLTEKGIEAEKPYPAEIFAEIYRVALNQAFAQYEEDAYSNLYCRPKNISMPGIQYGHRLLRLPFALYPKDDFAEPNSIYDGPVGRLHAPDVDLEELVRRYVNALYLRPITIYNLDDITEDYITHYFAEQTDILDPDKLAIFRDATKNAVNADVLREFIRKSLEEGRDLTPEQVGEWLLSDEASSLKDEIKNSWADVLAEVLPGAAPGFLEELPTLPEFRRLFLGLCVPNDPGDDYYGRVGPEGAGAVYIDDNTQLGRGAIPWEIGEYGNITREQKGLLKDPPEATIGEMFKNAVVDRINALADLYDRAWRAVKEQLGAEKLLDVEGTLLSGYEMKCYVSWLAYGVLNSLTGQHFVGYIPPGQPGGHRNSTCGAAADLLKQDIMDWELLISEEDIEAALEIQDQYYWKVQSFYTQMEDAWEFRTQLNTLLSDTIELSYKTIIDTLISTAPASRIRPTTAAEPEEEQVEKLYKHWTEIFANFLRQYSATRRVAKESRFTVRLAPRTGKYEETPKPVSVEGQFDLTKVLPSHPLMQTEQYMLEPIPDKYACNTYPTLYLREDLSLRIWHRGFGIGANLYSMSLLPEETQVITVKSFKDTKIKTSESTAENIFEETTDETAKDFATEMSTECERETSSQKEFSISGKASAKWGWGSASIETGYSSKSSSRSLAKNASNVQNRLASKLSAKRTVSVESKRTRDIEVEMHSELATEREVKNPNKGHTLTFHWYQMTRKLATELRLEDLKLVYTSGNHIQLAVFGNGTKRPTDVAEEEFRYLPDDIGRKLPPNTIIVVCSEPYTEIIPMSNANAFLARVFKDATARKISSMLWQLIGSGDSAPEGYGITAFCDARLNEPRNCKYLSVTDPTIIADHSGDGDLVPADEIHVKEGDKTYYLPNIDLRYKREDGLAPARYWADEFDAFSLPRTLLREEQVINTNGVFCDAMVGQCSALEDYLQWHRDLDLLEKKIEVGGKELDFKWALAKDGMVEITTNKDKSIIGVIKEKEENKGFEERLEVESAKRQEEKEIYEDGLEKERKREELNLLKQQLAELTKKVQLLGEPTKYAFDVPKDTNVNINVDLDTENGAEGKSVNLLVKPADE